MPALPRLREHVPLAPLTTLQVGGDARWFLEAETEAEIAAAVAWARSNRVPLAVLGGGSNLLVADRGFEGLVLRVALRGVQVLDDSEGVRLRVGAGERLDFVVAQTVADGLAGLECLSGVPGSIGATPIQNVGAYGQEVSETIVAVEVLDRETGRCEVLPASSCGFGYRTSDFKRAWRHRFVVLAVHFGLRKGGTPSVRYRELGRYLEAAGCTDPSLREVREAVLALRRAKSMVLDVGDPNCLSAGSFFVNPVVDSGLADLIEAGVLMEGDTMPRYPVNGEARVKLSAAWLIERAGFPRGSFDGNAGLSTRHALALVNRGGATASELVAFAARIRATVREKFGVTFAVEPELLGFTPHEIAGLTD